MRILFLLVSSIMCMISPLEAGEIRSKGILVDYAGTSVDENKILNFKMVNVDSFDILKGYTVISTTLGHFAHPASHRGSLIFRDDHEPMFFDTMSDFCKFLSTKLKSVKTQKDAKTIAHLIPTVFSYQIRKEPVRRKKNTQKARNKKESEFMKLLQKRDDEYIASLMKNKSDWTYEISESEKGWSVEFTILFNISFENYYRVKIDIEKSGIVDVSNLRLISQAIGSI